MCASECGTRSDRVPEAFIVHGEQAAAGRWPWQIGLYINGVYTCGGSLVSHDHVISAAHCTMYVIFFHQYRLHTLRTVIRHLTINKLLINMKHFAMFIQQLFQAA